MHDRFTDLVCLARYHGKTIREQASTLDLRVVGLIIQRNGLLENMFIELDIDVAAVKEMVGNRAQM